MKQGIRQDELRRREDITDGSGEAKGEFFTQVHWYLFNTTKEKDLRDG